MKHTMLKKTMSRLLINILLFPVLLGFGIEGDPAAGDPPAGDPPQGDPGSTDPAAGDPASGDPAGGDPAAPAEGAPEEYADFTVPDDMAAAKPLLDEFKPFLKTELNLSQEKAQALIDFYTQKIIPGMRDTGIAASTEAWNTDLAERTQAIKDDKEIGGEKYEATVAEVNRVANTFLKPEEIQEMTAYFARFGDCKPFLKILSRVGGAMKEGGIVLGGGSNEVEKRLEDRLYGDPKN